MFQNCGSDTEVVRKGRHTEDYKTSFFYPLLLGAEYAWDNFREISTEPHMTLNQIDLKIQLVLLKKEYGA